MGKDDEIRMGLKEASVELVIDRCFPLETNDQTLLQDCVLYVYENELESLTE